MCLADKLALSPEGVVVERADRDWILPGSSTFAAQVRETDARYVLLNDVTAACRSVSAEWADLLAPSNPRLRAPLPHLWVEWTDADSRQEVGVLVQAADDGRSGSLRAFWNGEDGTDVAQGEVLFDLDNPISRKQRVDGRRLFPVGELPTRLEALEPHLALAFDASWEEYFRTSSMGSAALPFAARSCGEKLLPDLLGALSFFALLGVQVPFRERAIDRGRLNNARSKAGKVALLDHVELAIGQPCTAAGDQGPGTGNRKNPRMHIVRGHLVRRRENVFWRGAHLRGLGNMDHAMPKTRIVRMHAG